MVPADSRRIPRVPRYSGYRYATSGFVYRIITFYDSPFQEIPLTLNVQWRGPTTPRRPCDRHGLGSSPFARHYLGNHFCFLFLLLLRCFSSQRLLLYLMAQMTLRSGCPIRISSDHSLFATPRSFSQLITSFFASYSLGILHAPFSFLLFLNLLDCLLLSNLVFNGSFHHVNVRFESV